MIFFKHTEARNELYRIGRTRLYADAIEIPESGLKIIKNGRTPLINHPYVKAGNAVPARAWTDPKVKASDPHTAISCLPAGTRAVFRYARFRWYTVATLEEIGSQKSITWRSIPDETGNVNLIITNETGNRSGASRTSPDGRIWRIMIGTVILPALVTDHNPERLTRRDLYEW